MAADPVFLDTGVLWSFAVADGLEDLERGLADRAMWTPAVRSEVRNKAGGEEPLLSSVLSAGWLTTFEFDPDAPDATESTAEIERLRQTFGVTGGARQHLGEAESIVAAQRTDGWFFTEDFDAASAAKHRGVRTRMTTEVLRYLHEIDTIDCPRALLLYQRMESADRKVPAGLGMKDLCGWL